MTDKEKRISQLCIRYVDSISTKYDIDEDDTSFALLMEALEALEKIHRLVNPEYDRICKEIEDAEEHK